MDLSPRDNTANPTPWYIRDLEVMGPKPHNIPTQETAVISSLELREYHDLCHIHLPRRRVLPISPRTQLNLGVVICGPSDSQLECAVEIASVTGVTASSCGWYTQDAVVREVMQNGWIRYVFRPCLDDPVGADYEYRRYNSGDVFNTVMWAWKRLRRRECWLSQSNHIFRQLHITSNYEDYGGS